MTDTRGRTGVQDNDVPALLDRWVRQGLLAPEQVERILRAEGMLVPGPRPAPDTERQRNSLAVEALGYLGGVLAMAAALLLVQLLWSDLSNVARLAIPVVAAVALLVAGAMVPAAASTEGSVERLRSVLWLLAVIASGGAFGVLGDQVLDLAGRDTWLLVGLGSAALGLLLYLRTHLAAQQLGLFVPCVLTASALGARAGWDEPTLIGLGGWLVAATWVVLGERRLLQPWLAARYLGAVGSVVTVMVMAGSVGGQVLAIATVAALFAWGVRAGSVGLLAVASIGTVQVVPSVIQFFFADNEQVAVPVGLLVIGGALVATAVTVTRRRARQRSSDEQPHVAPD